MVKRKKNTFTYLESFLCSLNKLLLTLEESKATILSKNMYLSFHIPLTLEEHGFEQRGSTSQIVFNQYSGPQSALPFTARDSTNRTSKTIFTFPAADSKQWILSRSLPNAERKYCFHPLGLNPRMRRAKRADCRVDTHGFPTVQAGHPLTSTLYTGQLVFLPALPLSTQEDITVCEDSCLLETAFYSSWPNTLP